MRPSRSVSTCSAVVGLVCMKRLALGAATGTPAARSRASATGCAGMRSPTVVAACRDDRRDALGARQDQGERAGPEAPRKFARDRREVGDDTRRVRQIGDVDDQRIAEWALLGGENARDGLSVGGVGAEAIDSLRGEGDETPRAQQRRRFGDMRGWLGVGVHHQPYSGLAHSLSPLPRLEPWSCCTLYSTKITTPICPARNAEGIPLIGSLVTRSVAHVDDTATWRTRRISPSRASQGRRYGLGPLRVIAGWVYSSARLLKKPVEDDALDAQASGAHGEGVGEGDIV